MHPQNSATTSPRHAWLNRSMHRSPPEAYQPTSANQARHKIGQHPNEQVMIVVEFIEAHSSPGGYRRHGS